MESGVERVVRQTAEAQSADMQPAEPHSADMQAAEVTTAEPQAADTAAAATDMESATAPAEVATTTPAEVATAAATTVASAATTVATATAATSLRRQWHGNRHSGRQQDRSNSIFCCLSSLPPGRHLNATPLGLESAWARRTRVHGIGCASLMIQHRDEVGRNNGKSPARCCDK